MNEHVVPVYEQVERIFGRHHVDLISRQYFYLYMIPSRTHLIRDKRLCEWSNSPPPNDIPVFSSFLKIQSDIYVPGSEAANPATFRGEHLAAM